MPPGDLIQPVKSTGDPHATASAPAEEAERLRATLDRERKARAEAEEIAERTLRDLYERQRDLELIEAVAAASNTAQVMEAAMQVAVDRICARTGWPVGHVYLPRRRGTGVDLVPTAIWHLDDPDGFHDFREVTQGTTLAPGEGLPGRVFEAGQPVWIVDVLEEPNFPRAQSATAIGVKAAFGFPALAGDEVVAILEFFSPSAAQPDEGLLDLLAHVGSQLGRVVERTRARDELTRHSEELERQAGELERANGELKEFAYVASHDLSEPLRSISGFVQLLAERYRGRLDSEADEFIDFVLDGTERMRHLIDDLLAYSRVGSRPLELETVDCFSILARVDLDLRRIITEANASIEISELPTVRADPDQLERLFENLISNAVKFRGPQPPKVRVFAEREGPEWRFSVIDNGIGIEPRQAERVFNVFQRLHARSEYTGTGIGLSICKRIVERHGGRIWVEQAEGGGSAFRFTIPTSWQDGG
jgi:signal transduction histidine kinase